MTDAQVNKLNTYFTSIYTFLDTVKLSGKLKEIPDNLKTIIRQRCNDILAKYTTPSIPSVNRNQSTDSFLENEVMDSNEQNQYNSLIRNRFPTREMYESYEYNPNDPLVPYLTNNNVNRIWRNSSSKKRSFSQMFSKKRKTRRRS